MGKGFDPFIPFLACFELARVIQGRTLGQQGGRKLRQIDTGDHEIPVLYNPIAYISHKDI